MFCAECGHDMRLTSEPMRETFRGEEFVVDGIERYVCDECGEYSISPEMADRLTERLAREYAMRHGLLAPDEIRGVRKALGLRQSEFERVLGVSTPSASRWETARRARASLSTCSSGSPATCQAPPNTCLTWPASNVRSRLGRHEGCEGPRAPGRLEGEEGRADSPATRGTR